MLHYKTNRQSIRDEGYNLSHRIKTILLSRKSSVSFYQNTINNNLIKRFSLALAISFNGEHNWNKMSSVVTDLWVNFKYI